MANHKSAEKRHRQSLKRKARNRVTRSELRTLLAKARESGNPDAFKAAEKMIAKAAGRSILHKRNASRKISRLARAVAKAKGKK